MIKKYNITVNGNTYNVEVEELVSEKSSSRDNISNQSIYKQHEFTQTVQNKQLNKSSSNMGVINAPMPGTINNICVNVGESIKKGQVLIILEAMKMENEIMASCDGTISQINVVKGSSVSAGDILITIE